MNEYNNIRAWVEDLPKHGKITFSKEEVELQFPNLTNRNILNTLNRLVVKKKLQSVWRNFWVIVPVEYALKGMVDPIEYIAQLMNYIGKNYYIGLLSAAAIHGASHQQPMELMIITDTNHLRNKVKNDVKISFAGKKEIPQQYLQQITVRSGYIPVSTPELTAIDLLLYSKNVGGINRVATVLSELAEVIDFEKVSLDFFQNTDTANVQRLGYMLDLLGYNETADTLLRKAKETNLKFRKYPLCIKRKTVDLSESPFDNKWKIIINEKIDLVQIQPENVGAILDKLREVLAFLGKPVIKQKRNNNTLVFKTESTFPPIMPIRLKVEINCKEHFTVLDLVKIPFEVKSLWFNSSCEITTYKLDELVGTKLRALYQRKKGRDLFDLWKALENKNLNTDNVVKCYRKYIEFSDGESPTQSVYIANMEEKLQEEIFLNDTQALLRPTLTFNPHEAYEIVKKELIEKL
jgi:predicted transcriptional regulator of viral defense system/predicted nucleotidyltransferase component of viral defense system